eukprot:329207-Prorocentrum_minimum.AAC.1
MTRLCCVLSVGASLEFEAQATLYERRLRATIEITADRVYRQAALSRVVHGGSWSPGLNTDIYGVRKESARVGITYVQNSGNTVIGGRIEFSRGYAASKGPRGRISSPALFFSFSETFRKHFGGESSSYSPVGEWRILGAGCSSACYNTAFVVSSKWRLGINGRVEPYWDRAGGFGDRAGGFGDRAGGFRDRAGGFRDRAGGFRDRAGELRGPNGLRRSPAVFRYDPLPTRCLPEGRRRATPPANLTIPVYQPRGSVRETLDEMDALMC